MQSLFKLRASLMVMRVSVQGVLDVLKGERRRFTYDTHEQKNRKQKKKNKKCGRVILVQSVALANVLKSVQEAYSVFF